MLQSSTVVVTAAGVLTTTLPVSGAVATTTKLGQSSSVVPTKSSVVQSGSVSGRLGPHDSGWALLFAVAFLLY